MKILGPHCGLNPDTDSGGERYEMELLAALSRRSHDLHLILAHGKAVPSGFRASLHRPLLRRGLRAWMTWLVWQRPLRECWRLCGPADVIRAHSVRFSGPACLLARRRYGLSAPVVTHVHHLEPSAWLPLERWILRSSDLVVADSHATLRDVKRDRKFRAAIQVVHPGVPASYRSDPVQRSRPIDGSVIAVACGPMIPRKAPWFLVDVWRHLGDREPPIAGYWMGDGPLRRDVAARARFVALGRVPEAEKIVRLRSADVFVHPSLLEGFALAPLEAMACGLPVVARRIPSMVEMLPPDCGILCESVEEFRDAIVALAKLPEMRRRMGVAAAQFVEENYRWPRAASKLETAYEKVIRAYRAPVAVT